MAEDKIVMTKNVKNQRITVEYKRLTRKEHNLRIKFTFGKSSQSQTKFPRKFSLNKTVLSSLWLFILGYKLNLT